MQRGGYIFLISDKKDKDGKDIIAGIIQPPLLKDRMGKLTLNNTLEIKEQDNGRYTIELLLDKEFINDKNTKYPLMFDICFEMRKEKQPDTQVFSEKPTLNQYLSNYTIIGNHPDYGDSRCFIRYQFLDEHGLKPKQIESVNYITYNMTDNNFNIDLFRVTDDWCSLTTNWNTIIPFDEKITSADVKRGIIKFDITEIAKKYVIDRSGELQQNGMLMKSDSNDYNIMTSNDSSLFPIRTEIIFK